MNKIIVCGYVIKKIDGYWIIYNEELIEFIAEVEDINYYFSDYLTESALEALHYLMLNLKITMEFKIEG